MIPLELCCPSAQEEQYLLPLPLLRPMCTCTPTLTRCPACEAWNQEEARALMGTPSCPRVVPQEAPCAACGQHFTLSTMQRFRWRKGHNVYHSQRCAHRIYYTRKCAKQSEGKDYRHDLDDEDAPY
jgi:hypothetical protein